MSRFLKYDPSTGQVLAEAEVPFDAENWIETSLGLRESLYYYVADGVPVAMPAQPSPHHEFDYATKQWADPRDLATHKEDKWATIKAAREAAEYSPFTWDGSSFDADSESQRRIQGASQLAMIAASASQSFEIDWTLADNTVRTLSGAEMIQVGLALGTHVATQHVIARTLREVIESATTVAEVEAVTWPS